MREILFRGLSNGEWIEGSFIRNGMAANNMIHETSIAPNGCYPIGVDHETVGQYTGLTDSKGVKIFEGDIVEDKDSDYDEYFIGSVEFSEEGLWVIKDADGDFEQLSEWPVTVCGDIHQNPELINQ